MDSFCIFVSLLKQACLHRWLVVFVPRSHFVLRVLEVLYRAGLISGFKIFGFSKIIVFLKFVDNVPLIKNVCLVRRSSRFFFLSGVDVLKGMGRYNCCSIMILSTVKGLCIGNELVYYKPVCGGVFFLRI
jgi:ribosomal protein S8